MPDDLRMYEIGTDEFRPVTQADVDRYQMWTSTTGCLLDGQDVLRSLFRAVSSGQLPLSTFFEAVNGMRRHLTKETSLQYRKQFGGD